MRETTDKADWEIEAEVKLKKALELKEGWQYLSTSKPERKRKIEYIDTEGNKGRAYLCHCGNEYRCSLTGMGFIIDIHSWKYEDEH